MPKTTRPKKNDVLLTTAQRLGALVKSARDIMRKDKGLNGAVRPDGSKGAGLFAYLRSLASTNGDKRRDVISTVFRGVDNRMKSGYLLRDVLTKVDEIHFDSSEEIHTLGHLYESMLREMRDAAGDSGEFYTLALSCASWSK